jgi:hypothetical protein
VRFGRHQQPGGKGRGDLDWAQGAVTEAIKTAGSGLGERDRRGYPYLLLARDR